MCLKRNLWDTNLTQRSKLSLINFTSTRAGWPGSRLAKKSTTSLSSLIMPGATSRISVDSQLSKKANQSTLNSLTLDLSWRKTKKLTNASTYYRPKFIALIVSVIRSATKTLYISNPCRLNSWYTLYCKKFQAQSIAVPSAWFLFTTTNLRNSNKKY